MIHCILNIGTDQDYKRAAELAVAISRHLVIYWNDPPTRFVDDASVEEPTFVVMRSFRTLVERDREIDELCAVAQQDCVAVWNIKDGYGHLVGPEAKRWPPFNLDRFVI